MAHEPWRAASRARLGQRGRVGDCAGEIRSATGPGRVRTTRTLAMAHDDGDETDTSLEQNATLIIPTPRLTAGRDRDRSPARVPMRRAELRSGQQLSGGPDRASSAWLNGSRSATRQPPIADDRVDQTGRGAALHDEDSPSAVGNQALECAAIIQGTGGESMRWTARAHRRQMHGKERGPNDRLCTHAWPVDATSRGGNVCIQNRRWR